MSIVTIDFEASCLPRHGRSYPIEVGICAGGRARSWLIRPHENWAGWDWTPEAEALHGLTKSRIQREGLPVEAVLDRLIAATDGRRVVADSLIDQYWLETLAEAAGEPAPFLIDHVSMILEEGRASERAIAAAVAVANTRHPARHRAACDAAWLSTLLDQLCGNFPVVPHPAMLRRDVTVSNNL